MQYHFENFLMHCEIFSKPQNKECCKATYYNTYSQFPDCRSDEVVGHMKVLIDMAKYSLTPE